MGDELLYPENFGIQDILIHEKTSNLVNTRLLTLYATSVNVWDNMASLQ